MKIFISFVLIKQDMAKICEFDEKKAVWEISRTDLRLFPCELVAKCLKIIFNNY